MSSWATYLTSGLNRTGDLLKEIGDLTKQLPKTSPKPVPIPPIVGKGTKLKTKQPPLPGVVTFNAAMDAVDKVLEPYAGYDTDKTFAENAQALGEDILKSFISESDDSQRERIYDDLKGSILSQKRPRLRMNAFIYRRL